MPDNIKDIPIYSTLEISQKLNVTPNTIWKYLKQGRLKGQKIMGRWFISGEEIIDFFKDPN
jgi:DNA-directed RNA polymerase specialized sigma24 family protein